MAKTKKQTAKPSAANASRKPAGKAAKKPVHGHNHRGHDYHGHNHDETCDEAEIELDDTERKTIDMVLDSDEIRLALETEVSAALTAAVRKFCRQYGTPLSMAQAQNVAMMLFGD
jgi:hypothetical protein